MWDQLDATISDFIVNQLFLNMFRASLRPSSGGQTAFLLQMFICPVVTVVMLESRLASCVQMLRNNWLTIKSLIVASSWSHIYLIIKDARSLEHKKKHISLC